jgi:hypothetical protein
MRRRKLGWILLASAAACAGCADPGARTFAVVLAEPAYLDCIPRIQAQDANTDWVSQTYAGIIADWRGRWDGGALRPAGGTLRLVPHDDGSLAWFADLAQYQYTPWNGVVLEGKVYDGYVDLSNVITHETEQEGCGTLTDVDSDLYATLGGGQIDGRIRRVEFTYFPSATSACAAQIECARNIALSGTEEP